MDTSATDRVRAEISTNDVVLYMNGTPEFPQCSASAQAAQILAFCGVKFKSIDVLADPGIRQALKNFSDWPTIPQLFVKGAFIGGTDIMREMFESCELQQLLVDEGILPNG
jgi:monothiol glutaredoxin